MLFKVKSREETAALTMPAARTEQAQVEHPKVRVAGIGKYIINIDTTSGVLLGMVLALLIVIGMFLLAG